MSDLLMMTSMILYWIVAIATSLFGMVYAFRSKVMPYHLKALETTWDQIDPRYQILLKALLNGGGFFGVATGFFMILLLAIPLRAGEAWTGYAVGGIGLIGALPLGAIVYSIKKNTAGNPPFAFVVALNVLLMSGLILFFLANLL